MSENAGLNRNLIFIVVFLASFFVLIALISTGFIYAGKTYAQYDYPDFFDKQDIENIRFFLSYNITAGLGSWQGYNFEPEGANFRFRVYFEDPLGAEPRLFRVYHASPYFIWFWSFHTMMPEEYGIYMDRTELLSVWDSTFNISRFIMQCPHITINTWFRDPNTTRNDLGLAFDAGIVEVTLGFGFSDIEASMNAWDIVGRLLAFQAVETGVTPVNILIAIPIWASIAYLAYRLILFALPFVG